MICGLKKTKMIILVGIILLVPAVVTSSGDSEDESNTRAWGNKFVSNSKLGVYSKAAVATMGLQCSTIGTEMLWKGGSAVDAAIAALLCEGVVSSFSSGIGGGFTMTIWDPTNGGEAAFLVAREKAPAAAHRDMYRGNAAAARYGGKAIAVPGELMGYWEAHQKYGKLPWRDLFESSIELCEKGFPVTKLLVEMVEEALLRLRAEPTMAEVFLDPTTNLSWPVGNKIKRPRLAETLRTLSLQNDTKIFYGGDMGKQLIKEIKEFGGIMEISDLNNYKVKWSKPISAELGNLTMYTSEPPGSGVILTFIMNVLQDLVPTTDEAVFWQRIVETIKWAYARRMELADPDFEDIGDLVNNLTSQYYANEIRDTIRDDWTSQDPSYYGATVMPMDDCGTLHVSVLAPDGSAVSVTSTINQHFGSGLRSKSTGIIFNDQMDDFSAPDIINAHRLPTSVNNYIKPGKRPPSSTVPTIVVDENKKVRLVIGGAGGPKITTAVTVAMVLNLWANHNIKEAIDAPRLHHQLIPMEVWYESTFNKTIISSLEKIGHKGFFHDPLYSATVTAISQENGRITANADYRREGTVDGY